MPSRIGISSVFQSFEFAYRAMSAAATAPKIPEAPFRLASLALVAVGAAEEEEEAALLVDLASLALQAASMLVGTSMP